jgi:hypothetical protein
MQAIEIKTVTVYRCLFLFYTYHLQLVEPFTEHSCPWTILHSSLRDVGTGTYTKYITLKLGISKFYWGFPIFSNISIRYHRVVSDKNGAWLYFCFHILQSRERLKICVENLVLFWPLHPGSGSGIRDGKKCRARIQDPGRTSRILFMKT